MRFLAAAIRGLPMVIGQAGADAVEAQLREERAVHVSLDVWLRDVLGRKPNASCSSALQRFLLE